MRIPGLARHSKCVEKCRVRGRRGGRVRPTADGPDGGGRGVLEIGVKNPLAPISRRGSRKGRATQKW